MAFQTFTNSFNNGWNQDVDPRFQQNTTYRDPKNVSITADGDFFSCKNIAGNTEVQEVVTSLIDADDVNILGAFNCVGTYNSYGPTEKNPSIIYFIKSVSDVYQDGFIDGIYLYDIKRDVLHELLVTTNVERYPLNFQIDGTIDAVVFGENNVDNLYWDDNFNILRTIEITDTPITNSKSIAGIPYAPIDPITYVTQDNGSGQLASGTYNICYRYFNIETKKYTTWSLFTNPIPVYPLDYNDVDNLDELYGGVANEVTKKSIVLNIGRTADNSDIYDSIQLAVLKNTDGLLTPPTVAFVTPPNTEWYNTPERIVYDGGGLESTIDVGEITIENACIQSAKTLVAKDNVLFRGNVKYRDLLVEDVEFDSACTIKKQLGLSGDVYAPNTENDTSPTLSGAGQDASTEGNDVEDFFGNTISTRLIRIHNTDICDSCGTVLPVPPVAEILFGGTKVPGYTDNASITVNNIVPGNEIVISLVGYPDALQKRPLGGSDFLFRGDYYQGSVDFFGLTVPGDLVAYANLLLGSVDREVLVSNYKYIVQQDDTPEDVARNIATQLNGFLDNTKASASYSGGSTFRIINNYPEINRVLASNRAGIVDFQYYTQKGIDLSVDQSEEELQDLRTNESSTEGGYKNPLNAVKFKGHFRNEVYRYGIVYQDEYGCWSRPVNLDFSHLNARNIISNNHSPLLLDRSAFLLNGGLAKVKLEASVISQIEKGDLIGIQNPSGNDNDGTVYFQVQKVSVSDSEIYFAWDNKAFEKFPQLLSFWNANNVTVAVTRGGEFSHADSGIDWKYPNRENGRFSLMSQVNDETGEEVEDGFIQPLGLSIKGIRNIPEWARSFAIVRVRRLRNILWQSPSITTVAVMPSVGGETCSTPTAGASPIGAYGPKVFTKGIARNIERDSPFTTNDQRSFSRIQTEGRKNVVPVLVTVPPEYMMQQEGINFDTAITPSGAEIKVVDAVNLFRTPEFDVDGSGADDGNNNGDQLAFGLRADTAYNYYYRDFGPATNESGFFRISFRTEGIDFFNILPDNLVTRVLDYGEVTNGGAQYTFPTQPNASSFALKRIDKFGLEPVSFQNCSNEVIQQKSLLTLVDAPFGDLTTYAQDGSFVSGIGNSLLNFNFGEFANSLNNVGRSAFKSESNYDARITELSDGACSSVPIVNLERGLSDDRYGTNSDVHQYIFTGAYVVVDGSESYDVDVWGGDCFISKMSAKISDTTIETNTEIPDDSDNYGVIAYDDYQEVISVYLESRVNCDLQASPFVYPVRNTRSLSEFSTSYTYPYNFSYSIENAARVFTSRSETEENRTEFPARIVYSNQKVFQTDVEGFDEYEALSFFDLPEEYGGITKLIQLANGNVYSIQESGVAVIPINKTVIEDGTGQQLVINSSTLINQPQYILNENGSQHIRSVKNSETNIFFMDAEKREVFKIGGANDGKISDQGLYSSFLEKLESNTKIPDRNIVSGYDFNNNEYWIGYNAYTDTEYNNNVGTPVVKDPFIYVWSDKINAWNTELALNENTSILYMVFAKSDTYIFGNKSNNSYVIEEMYTGNVTGEILGEVVPSEVTLSVNPDVTYGKTFDVLRIDSNNQLSSVEVLVEKENGTPDQTTIMDAALRPRHDGYEIPTLRDARGARMRGKYAEIKLVMNNGDERSVNITSLMTKYRLSSRVFR